MKVPSVLVVLAAVTLLASGSAAGRPLPGTSALAPAQEGPRLTVDVIGRGKLTGQGIDCPGDCSETYPVSKSGPTRVTLVATPAEGYVFGHWGGDCVQVESSQEPLGHRGETASCSLAMDGNRSATATFVKAPPGPTPTHRLSVEVTGSGTVTGPGISCPGDCSEDYPADTSVTLDATSGSGFTFDGWGSDCTVVGGAPTCSLAMNSSKLVRATFIAAQTPKRRLEVAVTGEGTVTGPGISCPGDCSEDYLADASVTLRASAGSAATFGGWGFECTVAGGAPTCTLAMNSSKLVRATFTGAPAPASKRRLEVAVTGEGAVTGPGISCPGDCAEEYAANSSVTLTAASAGGSKFAGWSGDCAGAGANASCTLTMDGNKSASASMVSLSTAPVIGDAGAPELPQLLPEPKRSLAIDVAGNGTVRSAIAGRRAFALSPSPRIACGVGGFLCYAQFDPNQSLILTAVPAPGFVFQGWSGACAGQGKACRVGLSSSRSVRAIFAARAGAAAVAVDAGGPRFSVQWRASIGKGTLVVRGRVSAPARLRVQLRRPAGGPLVTRRISARGGPFALTMRLGPGLLDAGARLFPGGFVVSLTGSSRGFKVPLQLRTTVLPAPAEGVVRRAFPSTTEAGPSTFGLPRGASVAWANFRFEAQPRVDLPLTVRWYWPDGRLLGTATKTNRPIVSSFLRSPAGLPSGVWRAELWAGSRLVQRLNVRIA